MPAGTIGLRFVGEISRRDYDDVLIPALNTAFASKDVRCLCLLDHDFKGYEAGAVWEDVKTGVRFGLGQHSSWKRTALVTDSDWIRHATALFGWMAPGELKLFPVDKLGEARAWVAA
jgi:SpoIIAA-like